MGRDFSINHNMHEAGGFNPRARVGRDSLRLPSQDLHRGFNPRARVGRDKKTTNGQSKYISFNPRARVGRDFYFLVGDFPQLIVSIHAPAWGATLCSVLIQIIARVSIHAPAWGATYAISKRII